MINQEMKQNSPYLGREVETAVLPNGAIVNKFLSLMGPAEPNLISITKGITVLRRFSVDNTVIIEGNEGVIIWDTGSYMSIGRRKYEALRQLTNKPIKAIIYSHNHYAMAAKAFVKEGEEVEIIAHPDVHKNVINGAMELAPTYQRNGAQHAGYFLPRTGPDATLAQFENVTDNDKSTGYLKPTYVVKDGEELMLDGVRMQFFHTPSDTNDSLTMWLPDHDTIITNSIWNAFPNIYTLRGQRYRNPVEWTNGIDIIRQINPQYLIPIHGNATKTRAESYELATSYRDGISFIYSQTIRGINNGLKSDEIAERVKLPEHLAKFPQLCEAYGEITHHVKGIYSGELGWFSMDAAEINPVPISFRSRRIIDGFGGIDKLIGASNKALEEKEYAWAAELITHVLNVDSKNQKAIQIKANALRQMGYVTTAVTSRAIYLTQALVLEGKVSLEKIPAVFPGIIDNSEIKSLPIEKSIKILEFKIDPNKSKKIDRILTIKLKDLNQKLGLHVRRGVAEYLKTIPKKTDLSIETTSNIWIDIVFGEIAMEEAIKNGKVITKDDGEEVIRLFNVFEL